MDRSRSGPEEDPIDADPPRVAAPYCVTEGW